MLDETKITEMNLVMREATTRYINITCNNKQTGEPFDFDGYTVQTHLSFGSKNLTFSYFWSSLISPNPPKSEGNAIKYSKTLSGSGKIIVLDLTNSFNSSKADKPDLEPIE